MDFEEMTRVSKVPRFPRGLSRGATLAPLATSFWFPVESLEQQAIAGSAFTYRKGRIWLGRTATERAEPVGWMDDRHMVTIAGSRSGKGTSAIIPALCDYPGSVICIDPKGENACRTAARRGFGTSSMEGMHQDVYVLDPYGISGVESEYLATFDPLAGLTAETEDVQEQAGLIAEALVVSVDPENAHWDESARALIEALILHVITWHAYEGDRTLGRVRTLLRDGDREAYAQFWAKHDAKVEAGAAQPVKLRKLSPFDILLEVMKSNDAFEGAIFGAASGLKDLGDRERGSILSTARRNLKFLDAPKMRRCLQQSEHTLDLKDLKLAPKGISVYLVLPSRLMKTHARWMRLLLNLTVAQMESVASPPQQGHPVLAILDEFPTLGHLPVLETAIGYMAGFGLKIWAIIQDLSQLQRDYPTSWETFLGNAGLLQFFGNSDPTTLDFIARRLGEIEVIRQTENRSETEVASTSDISDFDKLQRTREASGIRKALGSFALENSTESSTKSISSSETTLQTIQKTELMTPDEIRRYFSRASGLQIIALADYRPIFLRRTPYFMDEHFAGLFNEKETPKALQGPRAR